MYLSYLPFNHAECSTGHLAKILRKGLATCTPKHFRLYIKCLFLKKDKLTVKDLTEEEILKQKQREF